MRATRILFVLLGLACTTGLSLSACSDDDSGGKDTGKDPATGDDDEGDGDGDGADGSDDGDGIIIPGADGGTDGDDGSDDGDGAQCQDGQTQECTCADGSSKGEQYCFQGQFMGACTNCPCNDGDTELCVCGQGGAAGTHTCEGTTWNECQCDTADGGVLGPCPTNMTCQNLAPIAMGGACVDPNNMGMLPIPTPPQCTDVSECTAAGYDNAICTKIMTISDFLNGAKFCVQQCTPEATTPGGP